MIDFLERLFEKDPAVALILTAMLTITAGFLFHKYIPHIVQFLILRFGKSAGIDVSDITKSLSDTGLERIDFASTFPQMTLIQTTGVMFRSGARCIDDTMITDISSLFIWAVRWSQYIVLDMSQLAILTDECAEDLKMLLESIIRENRLNAKIIMPKNPKDHKISMITDHLIGVGKNKYVTQIKIDERN